MRRMIVMPAGRDSRHVKWINGGSRSWRLVANWYEQQPTPPGYEATCDELHRSPGTYKYPGLMPLMPHLDADEYWLPDDDLDLDPADIDRLFDEFSKSGFDIAQPSLTKDSAGSWPFLFNKVAGGPPRQTRFVEVMCPMFTKRALFMALPFFNEIKSGWGLDVLWSTLAGRVGMKIGVLDAIQIKHSRPSGQSELYARLKAENIYAGAEMMFLAHKYDLPSAKQVVVDHCPELADKFRNVLREEARIAEVRKKNDKAVFNAMLKVVAAKAALKAASSVKNIEEIRRHNRTVADKPAKARK